MNNHEDIDEIRRNIAELDRIRRLEEEQLEVEHLARNRRLPEEEQQEREILARMGLSREYNTLNYELEQVGLALRKLRPIVSTIYDAINIVRNGYEAQLMALRRSIEAFIDDEEDPNSGLFPLLIDVYNAINTRSVDIIEQIHRILFEELREGHIAYNELEERMHAIIPREPKPFINKNPLFEIDPMINKYLKYKNKYLSLKKDIFISKQKNH